MQLRDVVQPKEFVHSILDVIARRLQSIDADFDAAIFATKYAEE
jgi:hypothetical protein